MNCCVLNRGDYFEYTRYPIGNFKKIVFEKILRKITHGEVADLGCGDSGVYWSLGYIERVKNVSMLDNSTESVEKILATLETLNPEFFSENYEETLSYLKEEELLSLNSTNEEIAQMLLSKINGVKQFDFLSSKGEKKYDFVVAIESLEVVGNEEEFVKSISGAKSLLKEDGVLVGLVLGYKKMNEEVKSLIKLGLHGTLNPDEAMTKRCFEKVGFSEIITESVDFPEMKNYPSGIVFHAKI